MSDGDSTTSDCITQKMRQLHQLLSPSAQPQVISALTYDFVAKKEQELTPGSEWFVEVINDPKKSQYVDNLQQCVSDVAVAFSKMATNEDYVAVGYQGHVYARHQDTQSRNIQIPSGHHGLRRHIITLHRTLLPINTLCQRRHLPLVFQIHNNTLHPEAKYPCLFWIERMRMHPLTQRSRPINPVHKKLFQPIWMH
jgi:hypothetical protein